MRDQEAGTEEWTGSCPPVSSQGIDLALLTEIFGRVVTERTFHLVTILDTTGRSTTSLIKAFVAGLDESTLVLEAAHAGIDWSFDSSPVAGRPLVILVDDLHLAEQSIADKVALAAERPPSTPTMVIGSARTERPEASWIGHSPNATTIALSPPRMPDE